jgi:hypothetical protein
MKGIDSPGVHFVHVPGWMDGWMEVKAFLSIAYSNQQNHFGTTHFRLVLLKNLRNVFSTHV